MVFIIPHLTIVPLATLGNWRDAGLFGLAWAIVGFIVALKLILKKNPDSVSLAKFYLGLMPVLALLESIPFAINYGVSAGVSVAVVRVLPVIAACAIWYLYFMRSKRVQATYFAAQPATSNGDG